MTAIKSVQVGGSDLILRPLSEDNLAQVRHFCVRVNWSVSLDDLKSLLASCQEGFLGAFLANDTLISCIVASPLDGNLGYIGLFITEEEHRRKGIGKAVLSEAIKFLKGRNILMDSVADARTFYMNHGFNDSDQMTIIMFGTIHGEAGYKFPSDLEIREITASTFGDIRSYDIKISTIDRADHIPHYIFSSNSKVLGAFKNGQCVGYCGFRLNEDGSYKMQPLYSDSPSIATALIQSFLDRRWLAEGSKVVLYTLSQNQKGTDIVMRQFCIDKDKKQIRYRLHLKQRKKFEWEKIYSITNAFNTII